MSLPVELEIIMDDYLKNAKDLLDWFVGASVPPANNALQRTPRERFAEKEVGVYIAIINEVPAAPLTATR